MFARPSPTMATPAYRPTTSLDTAGSGSLGSPAARWQRLDARRDGCVERTVATSDGVRLAVRDYGSAGACDHTVVLLHGLCLTQASWANQIRQLVRRWGDTIRIITYDHRGHGRSTGAPMRTYRIDRLAADLAEVLTALHVEGPLTLAGHSMGGMTALAYLGRPAVNRPVEPQGLVLIATAAGRIGERGIGRLLATPATRMLFELVHHMPLGAAEKAIKALMRPMCEAITRYPGEASAERNALAAVAAAVSTTPLTTAAGFLPSLKRFDEYQTICVHHRQYRRRQRRSGRVDPSLPRTRPTRRNPRCYPSAPTHRRAHASPRSTTLHRHRNRLRDGHAPPRLAGMPNAGPSDPPSVDAAVSPLRVGLSGHRRVPYSSFINTAARYDPGDQAICLCRRGGAAHTLTA